MKKYIGHFILFILCTLILESCKSKDEKDNREVGNLVLSSDTISIQNNTPFDAADHDQIFYDNYHLVVNPIEEEDFDTTGVAQMTVFAGLPENVGLKKESVIVNVEINQCGDTILVYNLYVKNEQHTNERFMAFELMTQKSRFDSCKYVVVQILKQDSTLDTLDKVVFVTNPFYPNDIPFEVNDTTASKMRASVINKRIHGRPIYNQAILADMPDSNSFSSKSKIAFAKIALGLKKRRSIVFNKADTVSTFNGVYYIFDFEAQLSPFSSKENFTIFDITVDKRLYEISHYYMIRIKDGGKEKKKVIVAHTNGIPLEHCDSLLTR